MSRRVAVAVAAAALAWAVGCEVSSPPPGDPSEVGRETGRVGGGERSEPGPVREVSDGRYLMGTVLDVTLLGEDEAALRGQLAGVFEQVARIEAAASRHLEDSDLSRLNAAAGEPPRRGYSPHLQALLARSLEAGRRTGGAFDVTVGPLIALWWEAARLDAWPSSEALSAARARVGYEAIVVGEDGALGLEAPGGHIDLGGIGKGYALDVVRAGLAERGVTRGLLDFGGSSVWALGRAPDGGPWRLAVDARGGTAPSRILALVDQAVSVSSSLGESSTIGHRRVGHVVDPRTGETVDVARTAVVVGDSATEAEVWSTALLVLDPAEVLHEAGAGASVAGWVRMETGEVIASPGFEAHFAEVTPPGSQRGASAPR